MRLRAKNSAICEQITSLRDNQIARITSDFKMVAIKEKTSLRSYKTVIKIQTDLGLANLPRVGYRAGQ